MKLTELLLEANRNNIILVDFQPVYESDDFHYRDALTNTVNSLNKMNPSNIVAFYNGEDLSDDTKESVREHYIDYGLDESIADRIKYREKVYAWLRNFMDSGMPEAMIITIVRYMVTNKINDSRDIDPETMVSVIGQDNYEQWEDLIEGGDMIYIPEISIPELKSMSGALLGGGGKDECLKEIILLMNAFNIKYKLVQDWIYG